MSSSKIAMPHFSHLGSIPWQCACCRKRSSECGETLQTLSDDSLPPAWPPRRFGVHYVSCPACKEMLLCELAKYQLRMNPSETSPQKSVNVKSMDDNDIIPEKVLALIRTSLSESSSWTAVIVESTCTYGGEPFVVSRMKPLDELRQWNAAAVIDELLQMTS